MPAKAGIQVRDSAHPRRRATGDNVRGRGAADVAQQRIYPGDRPGEPGHHGQNRRPPKSEVPISNRPDKLLGTHPLSSFPPRPRYSRLARLPNSGGISPINRLLMRSSAIRLARLPNSSGISPLNWLSQRPSHSRLARLLYPAGRRRRGATGSTYSLCGCGASAGRPHAMAAPQRPTPACHRLPQHRPPTGSARSFRRAR